MSTIIVPGYLLAAGRARQAASRRAARRKIRQRLIIEPALTASAGRQGEVPAPPPLTDERRAMIASALRRFQVGEAGREAIQSHEDLVAARVRYRRSLDDLADIVHPERPMLRALHLRVHGRAFGFRRVHGHADCPAERPWAVLDEESGDVVECCTSKDEANRKVRSLYDEAKR